MKRTFRTGTSLPVMFSILIFWISAGVFAQSPPQTIGDLMSGRHASFLQGSTIPDFTELPSNITLTAVRLHDFMAPGAYDLLEVELHNPADSPYTITGLTGSSISRLSHPYQALGSEFTHSNQEPAGCHDTTFLCAQGVGFPVAPGQTARFAIRQVWSDPSFPEGNVMVTTVRYTLRLQEAGEPVKTAATSAITFLRIMNHTGAEDPAIFNELMQSNEPINPVERPQLQVSLQQPLVASAGQQYAIYARVTNTGEITVQKPRIMDSPSMGALDENFNVIPCQADCVIAGPQLLAPGGEWLMRVGTLVYQSPWLDNLSFTLDRLLLSVRGIDNLTFTAIHSINQTIEFKHSGPPAPNPAMQFTPREHMQALQHGLVRDPHTGKEWLPPVHTVGLTRAQLDEFLATNDAYRGMTIARASEVETLMENFVLSQQVLPGPLGLYQAGSHPLVTQITEFARGAGVTDTVSSRPTVRGVVRDLPILRPGSEQRQNTLVIRAPSQRQLSEQPNWGLQLIEEPVMENNAMRDSTGYWLVRYPGGIRFLPARPAMAADDYLWLNRVKVGNDLFNVRLQRIDEFDSLLRVSTLFPIANPSDPQSVVNFVFDEESGTVQVEEAWLALPDDSFEIWRLRLKLIPDSEPPVLVMEDAELTGLLVE
ncbi:hypothetical protein [Pseudohongiella spirulinae]|uniref:Uncharacterized protein n=1 Tax=Pseudohongiella spirulinae TaxID=1249552 RepID=A0A0S2KBN3_9GAMM|nr:hypothetical protein [Pseudohongiella spirulinae]ALO45728.1 hypothetical protein PS2015_1064 [Pseudohongiella spirulinae]